MRQKSLIHDKFATIKTTALALLIGLAACAVPVQENITAPPNDPPQEANVVSLQPGSWNIYYSAGVPAHPFADPEGAWSFEFPSAEAGGHVNYVQTPFLATMNLQSVSLTFRVESDQAIYEVIDPTDVPPATFHIFFEQQGDNLIEPDGRWWASPGYNLGSQDNQTITMTVPLTSDHWSNVNGQSNPESFAAAWRNVGWIGVTFGGQYFWGHGVAVITGTAKFILINYHVN